MKPFLSIFFIVTLIFTLGGCSKGSTVDAAASSVQPDQPLHDNAPSSVRRAAPATPAKPNRRRNVMSESLAVRRASVRRSAQSPAEEKARPKVQRLVVRLEPEGCW